MKKIILLLYLILSVLFFTGVCMSFNHTSFSGYYPDKIINGLWLFLTVLVIMLYWKKKAAKVYCLLLGAFTVVSIVPMAIPFFGMVYYFSTVDDFQQIDLNDEYRIERTKPGALYKTQVFVYRKNGLTEKEIFRTPYKDIYEKLSREIGETEPEIQKVQLVSVHQDSIGIEYLILGEKIPFYHKRDDDL